MNFYELKLNLNFPNLAGAIRRKVDVVALLNLNKDEVRAIEADIELFGFNIQEGQPPLNGGAIGRLQRIKALHKEDITTLEKYLKEHKMTE